jgi:hypothetical protein
MEAQVLLSKCSKHGKTFGIRVEKRGNDWIRTWAFPISDEAAKREGFDRTNITGSFNVTKEFPGCPYCGTHGMFFCGCGKVSCIQTNAESVHCYWCNTRVNNLTAAESFSANAGGY